MISWSLRRLAPTSPNWVDSPLRPFRSRRSSNGFRRIGREDRVSQFEASLTNAEVLPFETGAARQACRINAELERSGRTIGMPDAMIAGIALHHQLPLVTGNTAHFGYVRAVGYNLVFESW